MRPDDELARREFNDSVEMRIYRIRNDVKAYQSLVDDDSVWKGDLLTFDCEPKSPTWRPPSVYIGNPKLRRGHFAYLCPGALVVDESARRQLADLLEMSGELLPLPHKAEVFHVLNVMECVNALDEDTTEWIYGSATGVRIDIRRYSFHARRFLEVPLFKIPETSAADILTIEGMKDPDDEFKGRVERLGLTGLCFEEIWSS